MPNYVLLEQEQHQDYHILPHGNFAHTSKQHHVSLTINEFGHACSSYPVAFMKDAEQGQFRAVAMLGLLPGKNLFHSENDWLGVYVPAAFLRAPFNLGPDPKREKTLTLFIDEESDYISKSAGTALFDEQGPTQLLLQVQNNISEYYKNEIATHKFAEQLIKYDLLREIELLAEFDNQEKNRITGIYTINEDALRTLPDAVLVDFHKQNYLMPIHAMLSSLTQINRLMKLHNSATERKIVGIKMHANVGEE